MAQGGRAVFSGKCYSIAEVCRVYGEYMAGMRIDARWNRIVVGS
jgi:hypothetical protein